MESEIDNEVPMFLYKMSTSKGFKYKQIKKYKPAANFVIKQFLRIGEIEKNRKYFKDIFYSLTSSRIKGFIGFIVPKKVKEASLINI